MEGWVIGAATAVATGCQILTTAAKKAPPQAPVAPSPTTDAVPAKSPTPHRRTNKGARLTGAPLLHREAYPVPEGIAFSIGSWWLGRRPAGAECRRGAWPRIARSLNHINVLPVILTV
jgi:hypothetical protein